MAGHNVRTEINHRICYTIYMKEIIFATSNNGKVESLRRALDHVGLNVTVKQEQLSLIEPQADTAIEVAKVKAHQAYALTSGAVLVDDSSFHIEALNGFPGPYAKYVNDTIGAEGYLKVMYGLANRSAFFLNMLVFVDLDGSEHVFEGSKYTGEIADYVDDYDDPTAWSILFKVFIPSGYDKVLGRLTPEERHEAETRILTRDSYTEFAAWMKSKTDTKE